ncbi:MAG: site-specific DNA-methyltransferase, partial [Crenarchaeota archaeon]|nr:site-specific DNA-methyltransferase [Thermoproteota archaeon]
DNLDVLRFLLQSGNLKNKVKLIYIDPPYGTNSVFQSRNQKDSYKDDLVGSHFIEFIRRRLILLRELLCDEGSIYVHLDSNMTSQIKIIMDEVFGAKNFRGFITRKKCSNKNSTRNSYGNISDYILFYSKTENFTWHRATAVWTDEKILKEYPCIDEATGRRYKKVPIHAPGIRNGETGKEWRGMLPPQGKHWQYTPEKLDEFDRKGEIYWSANGNPRRKVFLDMDKGIPVQDIWLDTQDSLNQNIKITGYPTEKNPDLLKRIIEASSNENDIVLDCFAGSGTTLGIAEQLGRKWIGVDNSSEAIDNILKRFFKGLEGMGDYVNSKNDSENTLFQTTLFEPTSSYGKALKTDFELFSDSRYSDLINDILEKYLNG